jgi:hypothetical protein
MTGVTRRPHRSGVLVLRIWREDGEPELLRARIMQTNDVARPGTTSMVAGTVDDICAVVREWAEEFDASASAT